MHFRTVYTQSTLTFDINALFLVIISLLRDANTFEEHIKHRQNVYVICLILGVV